MAMSGWAVAIVAIGVLAVAGWLLDRRLRVESSLRRDPLGLTTLPPLPDSPTRPVLLLTGDSRAAHLGTPSFEGWTVVNRGISGQTTDQVAARFARDLLLLRPEHAVVIAGINDLKSGESSQRIASASVSLTDMARLARVAGVPLTFVEVWGRGDVVSARGLLFPDDLPARLSELNAALRKAAIGTGASVVSPAPLLTNDGLVATSLAEDDLHLNAEGNRQLAMIIAAALPPTETRDD
jgi:lysophospholipase L1-like esterase